VPSELELDSGNESTIDAAMHMANCDDADADAEEMLLNWARRDGSRSGIKRGYPDHFNVGF
jgi:hypothetical protein